MLSRCGARFPTSCPPREHSRARPRRKLRNPRPHSFFPCHDPSLSIYWPSPNRCVCRSRGARGEARTLNAQRSAIYPPADTRHMRIFVFELGISVRFDPLTDSKEVKNPQCLAAPSALASLQRFVQVCSRHGAIRIAQGFCDCSIRLGRAAVTAATKAMRQWPPMHPRPTRGDLNQSIDRVP